MTITRQELPQGEIMSIIQHTNAILNGYEGPYFDYGVDCLDRLIDEHECNGSLLYWIAVDLDHDELHTGKCGTLERNQLVTSDGYRWYTGIKLDNGECSAVFLVPWNYEADVKRAKNEEIIEGQRSSALYYTGSSRQASLLLQQYAERLKSELDNPDGDYGSRARRRANELAELEAQASLEELNPADQPHLQLVS